MMRKFNYLFMTMMVLSIMVFSFSSCDSEDPVPAPTVQILTASPSEDGYTIAFTIAATDADTYSWDFGDDIGTSTDMNATYTYTHSGDYTATVTVTNASGTAEATKDLSIAASQEEMLGGTWVVDGTTLLVATEIFGDGSDDQTLPVGAVSTLVPEIVADHFKFNADGSYEIIDDGNGQVFASAIAASIVLETQMPWAIDPEHPELGGDARVSTPLSIVGEYAICAFDYAVPTSASWEIVEGHSVTIESDDDTPLEETFTGDAIQLSEGAYLGMFNIPVVIFIRELTADKLTVEFFFNADSSDPTFTNYTITLTFNRPAE